MRLKLATTKTAAGCIALALLLACLPGPARSADQGRTATRFFTARTTTMSLSVPSLMTSAPVVKTHTPKTMKLSPKKSPTRRSRSGNSSPTTPSEELIPLPLPSDLLTSREIELTPSPSDLLTSREIELSKLEALSSSTLALTTETARLGPLSASALDLTTDTARLTTDILNLDISGMPLDTLTSEALTTTQPAQMPDLTKFEKYLERKPARQCGINVNEVVLRTICKNLAIRLSDINNRIAHDEFHAQEGIFDLRISGVTELIRTNEPLPPTKPISTPTTGSTTPPIDGGQSGGFSSVSASKQRILHSSLTIGQLLPTGGLLELLFDDRRVETNSPMVISPYYRVERGVQFTQPLLKNGGPLVTQSRIMIASYDNQISAEALRLDVMQQISTAVQLYYELIFTYSNVDVLRISLAQAQELLRVNQAKYQAGVLPELDVLQAQADVASRQEQVLTALQQVEGVSDQLKTLLAEICELYDAQLKPVEEPQVPEFAVDEKKFVNQATCCRPEFSQAWWEIERQCVQLRVAHNQTLPQADLFANYTAVGVDRTYSGARESAEDRDHPNYRVGVQFNYPLQNREARYRFHQAEKRLDSAWVRLEQTRNQIILDVRNAVRAIETNRQRIEVGRAAVEFNRAKVEAGVRRQAAGLATSFDVLAFQRDLANARIGLIRSIIDYNRAIVQLELAKGTLLDRYCIQVDTPNKKTDTTKKPAASR